MNSSSRRAKFRIGKLFFFVDGFGLSVMGSLSFDDRTLETIHSYIGGCVDFSRCFTGERFGEAGVLSAGRPECRVGSTG